TINNATETDRIMMKAPGCVCGLLSDDMSTLHCHRRGADLHSPLAYRAKLAGVADRAHRCPERMRSATVQARSQHRMRFRPGCPAEKTQPRSNQTGNLRQKHTVRLESPARSRVDSLPRSSRYA